MSPFRSGAVTAAAAMTCVGSSVAVSATITAAPLFTLQAVRYAVAAALLLIVARVTGRRPPRPRGREWLWLSGVAATGLVLFNVGVVRGVAHAEPAVIGVAVAAVPLVLALAGPLAAGRRPAAGVVAGAAVVTAGAALVSGGGHTDLVGLGWAAVVLGGEVAFTLLAVPVLPRLGAWSVALHTVGIAAAALAALGVVVDGPTAVTTLGPRELLAAAHLAVVVTALAFVLWYTAVSRIGADRAGLFTGVVPVTAALGGVLVGGPAPAAVVWTGIALVAAGPALGLRGVSPGAGRPTTSAARTSP
jgi:drug/metabolite transporter (DMT)-like permease